MAQQHRQLATAPQPQRPNAAFRQCCQAVDHKTAASLAAAAVVLQSCLLGPQAVAAVPVSSSLHQQQQQQQAWQPVIGDMSLTAAAQAPAVEEAEDDNLQEIEDDIMAQVAIPQELMDFMQMLQKGPIKSTAKLSAARQAVGFDRTVDGRVLLYSEDGEPFQVKNDMGVPGALLLRDAGGYMYYIPSTDADSLVQIDLSDDAIVAQLFANHAWEELLEPLEVVTAAPETSSRQSKQQQQQQPEERLEQLRLTERDFRSVLSLLRDSQQLPEEPLEELDAQEGGR